MVVTGSDEHYRRIKLLRSHAMTSLSYDRAQGHSTSYDVVDVGYNYRIDDIRVGDRGRSTRSAGPRYRATSRSSGSTTSIRLAGAQDVTIPFGDWHESSSNYILPIVLNDRCTVPRTS